MRRYFISLLVITIFLTSGCSIPVSKNANDITNIGTQDSLTGVENETTDNSSGVTGDNAVNETDVKSETYSEKELKKLSIVLYYQSGDGYLIPATRRVLKQEGIAKAAINGLIDSSINREELEYYGLYPVLPEGTEIRGLKIKDGTATIDFNSKLLEYGDKTAEKNIFSAIVYTLTEFKTVKSVRILVEGTEKSKLKYGTDLSSDLSRSTVLINSNTLVLRNGMEKVDIYLLKDTENQYSYTLPVSVEYPESSNDSVPRKIIEYLAKGPKEKTLKSIIPKETKLLSSELKGKLLALDFNEEIKAYGGGNTKEEGLMKQILFSMKQIEGIEKVKLTIEGKEDSLPEGTDIASEIDLSVEINSYIDKD